MDNKRNKKALIKRTLDFKYAVKPDGVYWIHINLHLSDKFRPDTHSIFLKRFVMIIWGRLFCYMKRGFYVIPTGKFLMFAVELRGKEHLPIIHRIMTDIRKIYLDKGEVNYLSHIEIEEDTNDYENGEGYLHVMNAVMEFNLLYNDHSPTHLIHTMLNSMLMDGRKENTLYKILSKTYGVL